MIYENYLIIYNSIRSFIQYLMDKLHTWFKAQNSPKILNQFMVLLFFILYSIRLQENRFYSFDHHFAKEKNTKDKYILNKQRQEEIKSCCITFQNNWFPFRNILGRQKNKTLAYLMCWLNVIFFIPSFRKIVFSFLTWCTVQFLQSLAKLQIKQYAYTVYCRK